MFWVLADCFSHGIRRNGRNVSMITGKGHFDIIVVITNAYSVRRKNFSVLNVWKKLPCKVPATGTALSATWAQKIAQKSSDQPYQFFLPLIDGYTSMQFKFTLVSRPANGLILPSSKAWKSSAERVVCCFWLTRKQAE